MRTKSVARAVQREQTNNQRAVAQAQKSGKSFTEQGRAPTLDSFQNVMSRIGNGTDNQSSFGTYNYNPITNLRTLLDFAYRSSWICRAVVQGRAKDMVRAGIDFESDLDPSDGDRIHRTLGKRVWGPIREGLQWGRLYGGAGCFIMIDGQRPDTPLDIERVGRGDFKGLLTLDRWLLNPSLSDLVTDQGSIDFGKPKFYVTAGETPLAPSTKIHHSRFVRFEGDDLPYYQRLASMLWGMSVLEPIWDRLLAFDSTTQGIAQLVYRASIRNLYIEKWKEVIAAGGKRLEAQLAAIDWVRRMQGNEGLTILDATDKFESISYTFTGLDSVLIQMGQQLAGATRYPMVILFGQSPVGFNATGASDIRMYYDSVAQDQNDELRPGLDTVLRVAAASEGVKIADDFSWKFNPLWQLDDEQKSTVGGQNTTTIEGAFTAGLVGRKTALKELKQQSRETGMWTNITEEEIEAAEEDPPQPDELANAAGMPNQGEPGAPSFLPGGNPPSGSEIPPDASPDERDSFLPRRGFLPRVNPDTDSGGAFLGGELERRDKTDHPPLVHIHHPAGHRNGMLRVHLADTNLPGRETEFAGHRIVVEVEAGQKRTAGSSDGATMLAPYGYFPNTRGNDGDCVDVFLGDNDRSNVVFVIDQVNPDTKEFHQHKTLLGFRNATEALAAFNAFYADGRGTERLGHVRELTLPAFGDWLDRYRIKSVAA